jgi:hypothetical protein
MSSFINNYNNYNYSKNPPKKSLAPADSLD